MSAPATASCAKAHALTERDITAFRHLRRFREALARALLSVPDPEIVSYNRTPGTGPNLGSDIVHFEIQGTAGLNYLLEVSDDLPLWTTLTTEPADAGGQVAFQFLEPQTLARRYYRARLE